MLYDLDQIRAYYGRLLDRKSSDYFERFDHFMLDKRPLVRELVASTFERLFPDRIGELVDVGCGTCFYFPLLARHTDHLTGVDICIPMLDQARELIAAKQLANCDVEEASAFALPFADGSVDAVLSWDFLHHVPDVPRAAREIARILKPGGRYVAMEPNLLNPSILWYHARRRVEWRIFRHNQLTVPRRLREHFDVEVGYDNAIISFLNERTRPLWSAIDRLTSIRPLDRLSFRYTLSCRKR